LPSGGPTPDAIRAWCTRRLSLGADGLFLLSRADAAGGTAADGTAAVRMIHFNADGTRADLCLNGTRCAARLAWELGWITGSSMAVQTDAGAILARRLDRDDVALELPAPTSVRRLSPEVDGTAHDGFLVAAGVPHFVLPWNEDLATAPVTALGARLRRHPALGPPGANVDFVRFTGPHGIDIRSYERGVEGETMACGTGVLAAAAAAADAGAVELPMTARTRGGFALRVARGRAPDRVELAGDAHLVARGELLPAAGDLPDPPPWR